MFSFQSVTIISSSTVVQIMQTSVNISFFKLAPGSFGHEISSFYYLLYFQI